MGLFGDLLKSITKGVVREEVNKVERDIVNKVDDSISSVKPKEKSKYKVPEKYLHFPQFDGVIESLDEKKESKYERCTMDYALSTTEEINKYIEEVQKLGYVKSTDVRYDKGNEYIIIENLNNANYLHLVFHIKF